MPDPIRQAIPTPEQIQAVAAGFGRIGIAVQLAAARMVEAFSAAATRPLLLSLNSSHPPAWRPLSRRTDPTIGRKRRARRARGRRIKARGRTIPAQMFHSTTEGPGILTVAQWAAARRTMSRQQEAQADD
jgi:hypothetical protein